MRINVMVLVMALLIATSFWTASPVSSQDLGSELGAALAANEQAVASIQQAESASSPSVARVLVLQAVSQAQSARTSLRNALALATTDEQRSRIQGLLDHLDAAINTGLRAQTATDGEISGIAAGARGELVEALSELRPFAPQVTPSQVTPASPPVTQLPKSGNGWADVRFTLLVVAFGMASMVTGLRLRSRSRPA